jgi:hypothetical protein
MKMKRIVVVVALALGLIVAAGATPARTVAAAATVGKATASLTLAATKTVAAPGTPMTTWTRHIGTSGGKVTFSDWAATGVHPAWCTWSSSPKIPKFNATVRCSGKVSRSALIPANTSTNTRRYTFELTVLGKKTTHDYLIVTEAGKAPPPVVTGTTVSLELASVAPATTSLVIDYTATVSATCTYSYGPSGSCAVPNGTISWELDGSQNIALTPDGSGGYYVQGGNWTYSSEAVPNCTVPVGGLSVPSSGCNVTWAAAGDTWVTATYSSSSSPSVAQTLEVQVAGTVDLGFGLVYTTQGNVGTPTDPGIGDCTMASVADWIETTYQAAGTVPSDDDSIAAYWSAEAVYNSGQDVGLTPNQLFTYWADDGMDGTYLTATDPVYGQSGIETALSERYVLLSSVYLNGLGGATGGHQWLIVGYSAYGPMIVTWGQEFQISWAESDSIAAVPGYGDVWSIGAASSPLPGN